MTTNFLHALEQDRRIRKDLNNSLPFPFSPNYTILPIQKYIDKDHSFLSNVKPYPSDKKDFSILYNVNTITMPKKEQPIVHVQPLPKELNLDKHYNIEKINPVNRIPDAYYQFQMKGKTDADIRLANLQEEGGTNNKFNNLLKNAETGESLEDINTNLKTVLEQIKKKKLDDSTSSSASSSASSTDPHTSILKANDSSSDSDDDDIIDNSLFVEKDDEKEKRLSKYSDYQFYFDSGRFNEEEQLLIETRLSTPKYPLHKKDEDTLTFMKRVLRNAVAQKKRLEKKAQDKSDEFAIKHYPYAKVISDEKKEEEDKKRSYSTL